MWDNLPRSIMDFIRNRLLPSWTYLATKVKCSTLRFFKWWLNKWSSQWETKIAPNLQNKERKPHLVNLGYMVRYIKCKWAWVTIWCVSSITSWMKMKIDTFWSPIEPFPQGVQHDTQKGSTCLHCLYLFLGTIAWNIITWITSVSLLYWPLPYF